MKNLEKNKRKIFHDSAIYIKYMINTGVYILQVFSMLYIIFRLYLYKSY